MIIHLEKFGNLLISRPEGREAYLAFQPTLSQIKKDELIIIDCSKVEVLGPSWADEFVTPLIQKYGQRTEIRKGKNLSVLATFDTLENIESQKKKGPMYGEKLLPSER
jgi:hypothetical protein